MNYVRQLGKRGVAFGFHKGIRVKAYTCNRDEGGGLKTIKSVLCNLC